MLALKAALCGSEELLASALRSCAQSRRQGTPVLRVLVAGVASDNSGRSGGRLQLGGNEGCVRGEGSREVLGVSDAAVAAACVSVLFCVWLRGSARYRSVVAWVLSDLIMSESGKHYPPSYIHGSVNLNLI